MTILDVSAVVKDYRGLRPLRLERLSIGRAEQVAILGMDALSAEVLIGLVTGVALPDSGEVRVFERSTASIHDSSDWLGFADQFGIVSERAVLLDSLSAIQNLAVPFSLEIEPPPEPIRRKATTLAAEVGLTEDERQQPVHCLNAAARLRVRLGRALALDPVLVILEHPSATLPRSEVTRVGRDVRRVLEARQVATLALTSDQEFAVAAAARVLAFHPGTGRLEEDKTGRPLFRWRDLFR